MCSSWWFLKFGVGLSHSCSSTGRGLKNSSQKQFHCQSSNPNRIHVIEHLDRTESQMPCGGVGPALCKQRRYFRAWPGRTSVDIARVASLPGEFGRATGLRPPPVMLALSRLHLRTTCCASINEPFHIQRLLCLVPEASSFSRFHRESRYRSALQEVRWLWQHHRLPCVEHQFLIQQRQEEMAPSCVRTGRMPDALSNRRDHAQMESISVPTCLSQVEFVATQVTLAANATTGNAVEMFWMAVHLPVSLHVKLLPAWRKIRNSPSFKKTFVSLQHAWDLFNSQVHPDDNQPEHAFVFRFVEWSQLSVDPSFCVGRLENYAAS